MIDQKLGIRRQNVRGPGVDRFPLLRLHFVEEGLMPLAERRQLELRTRLQGPVAGAHTAAEGQVAGRFWVASDRGLKRSGCSGSLADDPSLHS